MKQILITGSDSYIGGYLEAYLNARPDQQYRVKTVDVRGDGWRNASFSGYDAVIHVAGLAHVRETAKNREAFFRINRDLTAEIANRAKAEGVRQFIFFSSMSVYGMSRGIITGQTQPSGGSAYGESKLEAERILETLRDQRFSVALIRPPMVYGPGCKGNFQTIRRLACKLPVFPSVKNRRSMIYIENLCEFLRLCVDLRLDGVYFPQNSEYMNTTDLARWIAAANGKKLRCSRLLGLCARCLMPFSSTVQKAFGTLIYQDLEVLGYQYCLKENEASVRMSSAIAGTAVRKGTHL